MTVCVCGVGGGRRKGYWETVTHCGLILLASVARSLDIHQAAEWARQAGALTVSPCQCDPVQLCKVQSCRDMLSYAQIILTADFFLRFGLKVRPVLAAI